MLCRGTQETGDVFQGTVCILACGLSHELCVHVYLLRSTAQQQYRLQQSNNSCGTLVTQPYIRATPLGWVGNTKLTCVAARADTRFCAALSSASCCACWALSSAALCLCSMSQIRSGWQHSFFRAVIAAKGASSSCCSCSGCCSSCAPPAACVAAALLDLRLRGAPSSPMVEASRAWTGLLRRKNSYSFSCSLDSLQNTTYKQHNMAKCTLRLACGVAICGPAPPTPCATPRQWLT